MDLDKIHAGGAEEFQVFVNRCLALLVGRVEMHKEGRRDGFRKGFVVDQVENDIAFIHGFHTF